MYKLFLLSMAMLMLPSLALAVDPPTHKAAGTRNSFLLHNIGTGDGIAKRQPTSAGSISARSNGYLGDTATHEVGHVHKRIDKASPMKSTPQRGNIMQDYYPHSNLKR